MANPIAKTHRAVEAWCAGRHDLGLLILRVVAGGHLMVMTQDNVFSWTRMLEFRDFLSQFGFPYPLVCAVLSVAGQFGGGLALVLGLFTRFAGLVVAFNFVIAIAMVDSKQPYPGAFAALMLVATGLCLMFTGAGRYSLDHAWRKGSMTDIVLVAAMDRRRAIGRDNGLPWHLPDDFKRFKALTLGKPILMGRKTAESLGRALPGRRNLVLTRHGRVPFEGMQAVASVDEALQLARQEDAPHLGVIGGAEVYALTLPLATMLHLTQVDTVVEDADVVFPAFDLDAWRVVSRERHEADAKHVFGFEFVDYRRR